MISDEVCSTGHSLKFKCLCVQYKESWFCSDCIRDLVHKEMSSVKTDAPGNETEGTKKLLMALAIASMNLEYIWSDDTWSKEVKEESAFDTMVMILKTLKGEIRGYPGIPKEFSNSTMPMDGMPSPCCGEPLTVNSANHNKGKCPKCGKVWSGGK